MSGVLVNRPRRTTHDYDLILSTADNGKAVRIALKGRTAGGVRSSIETGVKRRQKARGAYHFHYAVRGSDLYVWVDKP